jgi:hypothetical protein
MSADGKIFAEHGQQIGGDPNRFDGWPLKPFFERDGKQYLEQPWGEEFVQRIFNDKELEFPIIDNLASESLGVRYAAKDLGVRGSLTALGKFARFILLEQSWAQGSQFVGKDPSKAPEWELDKIDVQTSESRWRFVANSLGPGDPLAAQLIESAKDLPEAPPLEQVELKAACDMRWVKQKLNPESGIEPCPHRGDLGGLKLSVESSAAKAARFRERLDKIRTSLPEPMRPTRDFELYVYGHTHKEHGLCSPFDPKAPWKPSVINDGAWQRTASDETFCALIDGKDPKQALRDLRPEDLPPCYPFVTFSSGKANLRYWVQPTGKPGSIRTDCTDLPPIPKHCEEKASDACPAFPVKQANN